jgi:shikimate kinase/3-dehydroquinate synthase
MKLFTGKQIFLTGFMATGKSKIGPILAERMNREFIDTDVLIVQAAGKTIAELFDEVGEATFRKIERECVMKAAGEGDAVISLGGGAVTQEKNWVTIRETGICVCLQASAETIFERVSRNNERPLMAGLNDDERLTKIRSMLDERAPFYDRADVFIASSEESTPEDTAESTIELLRATYEEDVSWKSPE